MIASIPGDMTLVLKKPWHQPHGTPATERPGNSTASAVAEPKRCSRFNVWIPLRSPVPPKRDTVEIVNFPMRNGDFP